MRNSPVTVVDAELFTTDTIDAVRAVVHAARQTGTVDLASLPEAARSQLQFTLDAYARGETVFTVADTKPLTSSEAAKLLGVSRTHLSRLCAEGAVQSFTVGNALRISAAEVQRILSDRARAKSEARSAVESADQRRLERAARSAGLS